MLLAPSSRQADITGSQELNAQKRDKIFSNCMSVSADKIKPKPLSCSISIIKQAKNRKYKTLWISLLPVHKQRLTASGLQTVV